MPQIRAVMSGTSVNAAAAQERLEEPRRLVDAQLDVDHCAVVDATYIAPSPSTRASVVDLSHRLGRLMGLARLAERLARRR